MRLSYLKTAGPLLLALAATAIPIAPAIANNVTLFNFNENNGNQGGWTASATGTVSQPWFWNLKSSNKGGGWQAFIETNSANSGSYLTSPCLVIDSNKTNVEIDISHRFDFPLSGTSTPNALGQVQFRVDTTGSGTAWGPWRGIPTQYFSGTAPPANYPPNYGPPGESLFSPLITSATTSSGLEDVQAWSGPTLNFNTGDHQPSAFTLDFSTFGLANGYELQLRFLMATSVDNNVTKTLNWEVNSVQIKGATLCVIPEPAGIALAATGLATGLGWYARRRSRVRRPRAAAVAVIWVGWALVAMPCLPGQAKADIIQSYDFTVNNGAWTPSPADPTYTAVHSWTWAGGKWSVIADGAINPFFRTGNYLTSPLITLTGTTPVTSMRLSMSHNYSLPMGLTYPSAGGQVAYRLNGSPFWEALPLAAFTTGTGSITGSNAVFGPSPLNNPPPPARVNQTAFVPPNYVPPTGGYGSLFPLINAGATFTGKTPNFTTLNATNWYVPSQAFISSTSAITSIQLRLIEANLGAGCDINTGWNVRFIELDSPTTEPVVPEPGTIILAATGGAGAIARWLVRRRNRRGSAALPSPLETERDALHDDASAGVGRA